MPERHAPGKERIKEAVNHSLMEWGVEDAAFSRRVKDDALAYLEQGLEERKNSAVTDDKQASTPNGMGKDEFPQDLAAAVHAVFLKEFALYTDPTAIKSTEKRIPTRFRMDRLEEALTEAFSEKEVGKSIRTQEPNYVKYDRYYKGMTAYCKPRLEDLLEKAPDTCREFLDPLVRFHPTTEPYLPGDASLHAYLMTVDQPLWLEAAACEAAAALETIHRIACIHCGKHGGMKWCGGCDSSWNDLHCSHCGSCFELKSKTSPKHIGKIFRYGGKLNGGSFHQWCSSLAENNHTRDGSDYVVLISRTLWPEQATSDAGLVDVEVAPIANVTPKLDASSFEPSLVQRKACRDSNQLCAENRILDTETPIRLKSTIRVDTGKRKTWFSMDSNHGLTRDRLREIAKKAFEEVFPGRWDAVRTSLNDASSETKITIATEKVDDVAAGLEKLKM